MQRDSSRQASEINVLALFVSCCLLFAACPFIYAAEKQNSEIVRTSNLEGIICTNYADWQKMLSFPQCHFWKPSKEEVLVGEKAIKEYLLKLRPANSPNLAKKLPQYRRQCLGITVNGRKRIYYNFYVKSEFALKEEPVSVDDGGDNFFNIEYDVQDGKCYSLYINGIA